MTQQQLGDRLNISASAIGQIESGSTKDPKPDNILGIVDVFNCDFRWLISGKGYPFSGIANKISDSSGVYGAHEKAKKMIESLSKDDIEALIPMLERLIASNNEKDFSKSKNVPYPCANHLKNFDH